MLLSTLLPLLIATPTLVSSQADIECPDGDLQTYLLALIDALYDNGLTAYEDFLVHLAETDQGYALLESISAAPFITLIPPVDSAFQLAGVTAPYSKFGNGSLADLFSYHALQGDWGYDKLPQTPLKAAANSTTLLKGPTGSTSTAFMGHSLQQGDGGKVAFRMAVGNSTSWSGSLDLSPWPVLDNLRILPVDTLIPLPAKLSDALKLPTSSRSPNGLTRFVEQFLPNGASELEGVPAEGGLTIFVPVDDAFDTASNTGTKQAHYSTAQMLWSPDWSYPGSYPNFVLDSGDLATLTYNGTGSYISIQGGVTARILRSDITLQNGVMHIVDTVLGGPGGSGARPDPMSGPAGDLTDAPGDAGSGSGGSAGTTGPESPTPAPDNDSGAESRSIISSGAMLTAIFVSLASIL